MKRLLWPLMMASVVWAQVPNPTQRDASNTSGDSAPIFRVNVTSRSTRAVNYRHRMGSTKVDLQGTQLMPQAKGEAEVNTKTGVLRVEAKIKGLEGPGKFGPEYLTYVLWAISPEGRPSNLGELLIDDNGEAKIDTTVELQAFGLIVTAEPYYGVTTPSDVVVAENEIRNDTKGKWEFVDAKYELFPRGQYTYNPRGVKYLPIKYDKRYPLELFEARNAVQLSQLAGADKYASDVYQKAVSQLQQAENYAARKAGTKPTISVSREAVQTAEDARVISIRRQQEEQLEKERQASLERENAAKTQAAEAARQRELAEQQRIAAEQQRMAEERRRAQAEAETAAAERAKAEALAAAQQAERMKAEADRARQEADAARLAAQQQQAALATEAEKARLAAAEADRLRQQAENDKTALRKQLLDQFNLILETRDTARGLIVNMSDVLFDTGKYTLRPAAREKLARLAGIILSHPGLNLEVEGHTDSVGGEAYNQRLSEQRADGVKTYLMSQGLAADKLSSRGFGKTMPVASNDTAAGRQQNRRVEIVVSGEVIGTKISSMRMNASPAQPQ